MGFCRISSASPLPITPIGHQLALWPAIDWLSTKWCVGESGPQLQLCSISYFLIFPDTQDRMGFVNEGVVYAVFDYEAENPDELSFRSGDRILVLRKGDECEQEWWWSQMTGSEGYVPRNLLGVS